MLSFEEKIYVPILRSRVAAGSGVWGTRLTLLLLVMLIAFAQQKAQAQTYSVLHNFVGTWDGAIPWAGMSMDASGNNLYGTTRQGGWRGCGTVFKLTRTGSTWAFTTIYTFLGGSDGCFPYGKVVIGPKGDLYGVTWEGGNSGCGSFSCGTIYNLQPRTTLCTSISCATTWKETVLYRFTGGSDGSNPEYTDLVFDQAGNLYGTAGLGAIQNCSYGGGFGCGVVYQLARSGENWAYTVLYSFTGNSDGGMPVGGVILDSFGDLYGTTWGWGYYGGGTIYELLAAQGGYIFNTIYSFAGGDDGKSPLSGLIFDQSGTLYGTTPVAGANGGGTVYSMVPALGNWTFNVVHSFPGNYVRESGPIPNVTMDSAGALYGTTVGYDPPDNGRVFKITLVNGNWIETDLYDFMGASDGGFPAGSVVLDGHGVVYGTAQVGGAFSNGVVFQITQ